MGISNYILYKVWDGITYPIPNFNNGVPDKFGEWISNFIPHFIMKVITYPYPKNAIWLWSPPDSCCQHSTGFDLWPTHPGNLIPVLGRPDTLTQPLLRAPKPDITSQPQPASQLNIGTQLTSRGKAWHQTHVVACSLYFTSYNLKYITDHSAEQQYFQR